MAGNAQVGSPIVVERPPLFDNFTIRGGTYEEDDATKTELNPNADEETFNVTAYDEGEDIKLQGYPAAGYNPRVNDVLTETWNPANGAQPGGWVARAFVITKRKRTRFGKRGLIYVLDVIRRTALDTSQVTPNP
jgi:hypothetical protein